MADQMNDREKAILDAERQLAEREKRIAEKENALKGLLDEKFREILLDKKYMNLMEKIDPIKIGFNPPNFYAGNPPPAEFFKYPGGFKFEPHLPIKKEEPPLPKLEIDHEEVIPLEEYEERLRKVEEHGANLRLIQEMMEAENDQHKKEEEENRKAIEALMKADQEEAKERERLMMEEDRRIREERQREEERRREEEERQREEEEQIQMDEKRWNDMVERGFQRDQRGFNNFDLGLENAEEQRQILEMIQKQQRKQDDQKERMRLLAMMEGDKKKARPQPYEPDMEKAFAKLFDDAPIEDEALAVPEEPPKKPLQKTGFGMFYVRWLYDNPGFEWYNPQTNEPMNKIDYFKLIIWDSMSPMEKERWMTRAFNKNNHIIDIEEQREIEELKKKAERLRLIDEKKRRGGPPNGQMVKDGYGWCPGCRSYHRRI